jgi:hypothetical protein
MVARTLISDSGAVIRQAKRILISDSTATVRVVKRLFISDSGAVARLVFTGADFLALIAGSAGGSNGYTQSAFGSLTPSTLGDGSTVTELASAATFPHNMIFQITGYSGTITSGYLTSLAINASVFLATSASFSGGSSGGSASWTWNPGFGFSNGSSYSITVQRT